MLYCCTIFLLAEPLAPLIGVLESFYFLASETITDWDPPTPAEAGGTFVESLLGLVEYPPSLVLGLFVLLELAWRVAEGTLGMLAPEIVLKF